MFSFILRCLFVVVVWVVGMATITILIVSAEPSFNDPFWAFVHKVALVIWTICYFGVLVILAFLHSSKEERIREEERIRADERRKIWEEERRMYDNNLPPIQPPILPNTNNNDRPNIPPRIY